ncbi:hypothetical protein PIB30_089079 [Stylosanthes scabra]|uniref:Uncharacterized protein n=1 Tax=Stylosanthes scabra TaxID=79078 RepID=A0ABU6ZSL1_9FABA|nr:hypothetical protein [Stylosanthes scabra]
MTTGRINQVESVTDPACLAAGTTHEGERRTAKAAGVLPSNRIIRGTDGEHRPRLGRMHRTRKNRTLTRADRGRDDLQTTPVRVGAYRLPRQHNAGATGWRCSSKVGIPLNGNATQEPPTVAGSTNARADTWKGFRSTVLCPRQGDGQQSRPVRHSSADTVRKYGNPGGTAPHTPWGCEQAEGSEGDESAPRGRFSNTNPDRQRAKAQPREHPAFARQVFLLLPSGGCARGKLPRQPSLNHTTQRSRTGLVLGRARGVAHRGRSLDTRSCHEVLRARSGDQPWA